MALGCRVYFCLWRRVRVLRVGDGFLVCWVWGFRV